MIVAFDLDDTLFREMQFVESGFQAVARVVANRMGANWRVIYSELIRSLQQEGRGKQFDRLADEFPYCGVDVADMVRIYRTHEPVLDLDPDVSELLTAVRDQDHTIHVLTDGDPATQRSKIRALGLETVVDSTVYTWDDGPEHGKPSPDGFFRLLQSERATGDALVYVGDNPLKDFIAARDAGGTSIRLLRGPHAGLDPPTRAHEPDFTVPSLPDVLPALLEIARRRAG